jgi:uncharacterized membrane protein
VTLFVSTDTALDTGVDQQIATITKKIKLNSTATKTLKLKIPAFPSVADGAYNILGQVTATGVDPGVSVADEQVVIAAPFVDLSGTFATLPAMLTKGKKGRASITVTNTGNVDAKGLVAIQIAAAADASGAGAGPVATANAKLAIKPGKSKAVKLNFLLPAETPSGTFFVVAGLDAANVLPDKDRGNNTVISATSVTVS